MRCETPICVYTTVTLSLLRLHTSCVISRKPLSYLNIISSLSITEATAGCAIIQLSLNSIGRTSASRDISARNHDINTLRNLISDQFLPRCIRHSAQRGSAFWQFAHACVRDLFDMDVLPWKRCCARSCCITSCFCCVCSKLVRERPSNRKYDETDLSQKLQVMNSCCCGDSFDRRLYLYMNESCVRYACRKEMHMPLASIGKLIRFWLRLTQKR